MRQRIVSIGAVCALIWTLAPPAVAEDPYEMAWARQLGTSDADISYAVAADADGNVFISGYTWGSLGGPNAGGLDAFLAKYEVPEPATLGLLLVAGLALLNRRCKSS